MKFNPKWIVGKRVASVEMNPLRGGQSGGSVSHNPVIYFADGSQIWFTVQEGSDKFGNAYGVGISYYAGKDRNK